ncbi:uncharacterized protein BO96DRAFT_352954, partial [Aspergillus niger CBS 101883]|uniref:uncharacterized protein n=1 Tax=Aspergillus lacticoffeatus (strain CBS 101883) TaxID=1450533 RepID=UPI000D7EB8D8
EIAFANLYVLQHGEIEEAAGGKSNRVDTIIDINMRRKVLALWPGDSGLRGCSVAEVKRENRNCPMFDQLHQPVGFKQSLLNSLGVGHNVSFEFGRRYPEKFREKANCQDNSAQANGVGGKGRGSKQEKNIPGSSGTLNATKAAAPLCLRFKHVFSIAHSSSDAEIETVGAILPRGVARRAPSHIPGLLKRTLRERFAFPFSLMRLCTSFDAHFRRGRR